VRRYLKTAVVAAVGLLLVTDVALPAAPDTTGLVLWRGLAVTEAAAFADDPWAGPLFDELNNRSKYRPDLVLGSRLGDSTGEYLNVRDTRRVSYEPKDAAFDVWFFGGSTMFGIGQRDGHTIPSEVARLAERDGVSFRPVNFGVSADVNWTETLRFAEALENTTTLPELVVFYDGCNEMGLSGDRVGIGNPRAGESSRLSVSDKDREQFAEERAGAPEPSSDGYDSAKRIGAAQYGRGVELGRRLAASFGVPVSYFWQPLLLSKVPRAFDAETFARLDFDPDDVPVARSAYQEIGRARPGVVDLSGALDALDQPVLLDYCHTDEVGAATVAAAMYDELRPELRRAAR